MRSKKRDSGFTLIELMIVVTIVGILAGIAYASYTTSVTKSRRADAKVELNSVLQRMHRCFTTTNTYQPAAGRCGVVDELGTGITSREQFYLVTVDNLTDTTFTLVATPIGLQANDAQCAEFRLTHAGRQTALGSGADPTAECW